MESWTLVGMQEFAGGFTYQITSPMIGILLSERSAEDH